MESLALTTLHPFGISYGTASKSRNLLVTLHYGDLIGLGEATPVSYHGESLDTVEAVLKQIEKADILGDDPFAIRQVMRKIDKLIAGHTAAKSAVEIALHDLSGKIAGLPTYKMLGLSGLKQPITDFTIGIDSLEMIE